MERKTTNQFHGITQFFNILRYVRKSGEVTPFDGTLLEIADWENSCCRT